nr:MAG: ORF1 [Giant panda anellovirus]
MAYLPRAAWIRRRYGHYAGRPRTFRRSFYNRWWFRRGYRRRHSRRRRFRPRRYRVRRWMTVKQHNPTYRRRCVIRGWMPFLWCDRVTPFFRPMILTGTLTAENSGGWTLHELSLQNFYSEHLGYRNIWSQSNCGFDLARYHGTTMTFWPHQSCDYVVWWDTDYSDLEEYKKLVGNIHPAILLNRKHVRLVLSVETTRTFKPVKIRIPPPSITKNEWRTMKTWAGTKLALLAVSVIDFRYPWINPMYTIYNTTAKSRDWTPDGDYFDFKSGDTNELEAIVGPQAKKKTVSLADQWWNINGKRKGTAWAEKWPGWTGQTNKTQLTLNEYWAISQGPLVKKLQVAECQLLVTYRSYWTWGGDVLTRDETVCDPSTYNPPQVRYRRELQEPKYYLDPEDIRKDGFIKPEAWRRLTAETTGKARFTHYPGETSTEEETDQEIGALPFGEETEEDSPSPSYTRYARRRMDGGRIEELQRLRYLLKHIMLNKRSYSV